MRGPTWCLALWFGRCLVACGTPPGHADANIADHLDAPADDRRMVADALGFDARIDVGRLDAGGDGSSPRDVSDLGFEASVDRTLPRTDDGCEEGAHVDCFGGFSCQAGRVVESYRAPYPTCTYAQARLLLEQGICNRGTYRCPSGACGGDPTDGRYSVCADSNISDPTHSRPREMLAMRCHNPLRRPGDPCTENQDCRPAIDEDGLALQCDADAGVCVTRPRPEIPGLGLPCGPEALDGGPRCPSCAAPTPDCMRWRCQASCIVDEDCPIGWVCRQSSYCYGHCVPRATRSPDASVECW